MYFLTSLEHTYEVLFHFIGVDLDSSSFSTIPYLSILHLRHTLLHQDISSITHCDALPNEHHLSSNASIGKIREL